MKKQQILALIMAGTIVTGMAPAAVFGETDAPAVSIEGEAAVAAESEEGAVVEETLTEGTDASQTEDVPRRHLLRSRQQNRNRPRHRQIFRQQSRQLNLLRSLQVIRRKYLRLGIPQRWNPLMRMELQLRMQGRS